VPENPFKRAANFIKPVLESRKGGGLLFSEAIVYGYGGNMVKMAQDLGGVTASMLRGNSLEKKIQSVRKE